MRKAAARRWGDDGGLFAAIGAFLDAQGLSPDPAHYNFAHAALTEPAMAAAVARLTDGGVRLGRREIEALGGEVAPVAARALHPGAAEDRRAAKLVAETQAQVDGFAALMRSISLETSGFGRDLAESAAAIRRQPPIEGIDEIARLTGAMASRIRDAEQRLATATAEADGLRAKLAEAQTEARRDALTGLANRLAFEEAFARADPAAGLVCLAVCDVDKFKRLNDEYGHGLGDRVLVAIGQGLAAACDGHLVARHGGEEFAVLLQGLTLKNAAALLDAARAAQGDRRFRNRETEAPIGKITLSGGVIAVRAGEAIDAALGRADRLLYAAKAGGRDQICAG